MGIFIVVMINFATVCYSFIWPVFFSLMSCQRIHVNHFAEVLSHLDNTLIIS